MTNDLKSMLKLQARLHKKQGAESLGLLFDSALSEIETLEVRAEALQRELENERMMSMKRLVETGRADKFAIEQQIKGIYLATNHVADNNDISYLPNDFILELCEKYAEQLRQQLSGGEHADCELECGAYGTYCKCKSEKLAKQDKGGE